jgi:hypothetical protein
MINQISKCRLKAVFAIAAGLSTAACSGIVAPENKIGSDSNSDLAQYTGDATGTGADAGPGSKTTVTPADTSTESLPAATVPSLGQFEGTSGDLLQPKSGYAIYTDSGMLKSFSISISNSELKEDAFDEVKSWECRPCKGPDDPACKSSSSSTPATASISWVAPFAGQEATAAATAQGYPKSEKVVVTGDFAKDPSGLTISSFGTNVPLTERGKGTIEFVGALPKAVGDEFEVTIDMNHGGKTLKTTLSSKVVKSPTNPTPPAECDNPSEDKKWASPVY